MYFVKESYKFEILMLCSGTTISPEIDTASATILLTKIKKFWSKIWLLFCRLFLIITAMLKKKIFSHDVTIKGAIPIEGLMVPNYSHTTQH